MNSVKSSKLQTYLSQNSIGGEEKITLEWNNIHYSILTKGETVNNSLFCNRICERNPCHT